MLMEIGLMISIVEAAIMILFMQKIGIYEYTVDFTG